MKASSKLATFLGLAALALAPLARAEDQPATPPTPEAPANPPGGKHGHHDRAANRVKMLEEKLHLTDAQKQQVQAIFSQSEQQGKAIRNDDSLSDDDRRAKMGEIMKDTHTQIRALLTPEQQTTFDAMPKERRGHRGPPKGDGDGDGPPPPKPQ